MTDIIPAIIPQTFDDLRSHAERVKGVVTRVQVDMLDGVYVPEAGATWPYAEGKSQTERLPFLDEIEYEIDLMASRPEEKIDELVSLGARAIILHVGSTDKLAECADRIVSSGCELGLAVLPSANIPSLLQTFHGTFKMAQIVQFMGNDRIGFHEVELDERIYELVRHFKSSFPGPRVAVDIGITRETAPRLVEAGVDVLVSGSAIFKSKDPSREIEYFRSL